MQEVSSNSSAQSIDYSFLVSPETPPDQNFVASGMGYSDCYTARKRVFANGSCELTVTKDKVFTSRSGGVVSHAGKAKRGESQNREASELAAGKRAKKNVRLCCKEIGADRMVTLTYRENMVDRDRALGDWKKFCRRLGKTKAFYYVAVIEMQQRGAIHFHVAVRGRQSYQLLRSIWQDVVGLDQEGRKMGQVNVRDPHRFGFGKNGAHKLASYIAKYCSKQMEVRDLNEKRYFRSRGIVLPESVSWRLASTSMLHAVQTAFLIASEHGFTDMQYWCNNGLGVVWIATAPGLPLNNFVPF
jgi:hypothetical protein